MRHSTIETLSLLRGVSDPQPGGLRSGNRSGGCESSRVVAAGGAASTCTLSPIRVPDGWLRARHPQADPGRRFACGARTGIPATVRPPRTRLAMIWAAFRPPVQPSVTVSPDDPRPRDRLGRPAVGGHGAKYKLWIVADYRTDRDVAGFAARAVSLVPAPVRVAGKKASDCGADSCAVGSGPWCQQHAHRACAWPGRRRVVPACRVPARYPPAERGYRADHTRAVQPFQAPGAQPDSRSVPFGQAPAHRDGPICRSTDSSIAGGSSRIPLLGLGQPGLGCSDAAVADLDQHAPARPGLDRDQRLHVAGGVHHDVVRCAQPAGPRCQTPPAPGS